MNLSLPLNSWAPYVNHASLIHLKSFLWTLNIKASFNTPSHPDGKGRPEALSLKIILLVFLPQGSLDFASHSAE